MLSVTELLTPLHTPKTGIDAKRRRAKSKSTWVRQYGYVRLSDKREGLLVIFLPYTLIFYPDSTMYQFESMRASESKGRWIHSHMYTWPYDELDSSALTNAIHNY
jgi:hypothetical protein